MGASQSGFQKANQPSDITENKFLDKLKEPEPVSSFTQYGIGLTVPNIVDDDLKRYTDEYKFLVGNYGSCSEATDKDIKKDLEEIEQAYKLYLLYDNYKVKNKVMNEDLNKKFKNQNRSIKDGYESVDKINVNINQLELTILNKKRTQKILNFIITILVVIILVLAFLIYKKKFANYNFNFNFLNKFRSNTNMNNRRTANTNMNNRRTMNNLRTANTNMNVR